MVDQPLADAPVSAERGQRIDVRALRAWRVAGALQSVIFLLIAAGVSVLLWRLDISWWISGAVLALAAIIGVLLIWVIPSVRWRHWRYDVTEHELHLQRGILILTWTLVPMVRVQHVNTKQGPILRHYGLASVEVATAAGAQEIPALAIDVADELRNRIAELAGVAEDV